ncbi:hypothetical protein NKH18_03815 [Streptomyces sp. M10(2022)]
MIDPAAVTEGRDWQFAVMSDAQFVARDPGSAIVQQARRTLREIKAARPDFLVVNGDLVDEDHLPIWPSPARSSTRAR